MVEEMEVPAGHLEMEVRFFIVAMPVGLELDTTEMASVHVVVLWRAVLLLAG